MKSVVTGIMLFLFCILPLSSTGQGQLRTKHFNVSKSGLAIDGYDPVSYFNARRATKGKKEIRLTKDGITYHFSSVANRDAFKANPFKFEPQYGGWCAYAMGDSGEKVEIDPETFKIVDDKLFLFYNKFFNNTLTSWNKDEANLKKEADKNWPALFK